MRRQFLSIAGPLDDDLIAGIGQVVQGTVAEDGIVEEAEPFLHSAVAGDQLIKVGRLLVGEAVEAQVGRMSRPRYIYLLERRLSGAITELVEFLCGSKSLLHRSRRALHHPGGVPQPRALLRQPAALNHLLWG